MTQMRPHSKAIKLKADAGSSFRTAEKLGAVLRWTRPDVESGRFRIMLNRFLARNIPVINSCIWTWVRLSAAPGTYKVYESSSDRAAGAASARLERLSDRLYTNAHGDRAGLVSLLPDLFTSMYQDGFFGGFLTVYKDGGGVDSVIPVDPLHVSVRENDSRGGLLLDVDGRVIDLDRPDFYLLPFNTGVVEPLGRSILQAVPFVAYVEQQLVDDMRRSSHNSGFHRLHVKITPPERLTGESDNAFTGRINQYFDDTVEMIKSCDVDDNPVTWDNVTIEHVGPSQARQVGNSWFMTHRAMIEDICAGTNLAPYLLGYSYGATTTWSAFKFDVVMRQVRSVQAEVGRFLEWIGNIELALAGIDARCRFVFDNTFAYQAMDRSSVETSRVDNVLKLFNAGLIDADEAKAVVRELI